MKRLAKSKENIYNEIINTLMQNDKNGTYDEILEDNNNNLDLAISDLKNILERIISEDGLEGEELQFYKNQLNELENIYE